MIRVLMLDLGETLIHDGAPLPHVTEALQVLTQFETASGDPLAMCLVSDFDMPEGTPTPAKIDALFQKYLEILDQTGLRHFFEGVAQHVTLSTHAGVLKPAQKIFDTAIERLGVDAKLEDCLFITEDVDHIKACDKLRMKTLTFGKTGTPGTFGDWSKGPMLIARLVAPSSQKDTELALKASLAATHRMDLVSAAPGRSATDPINARVKVWHKLSDPSLGVLDGVHVELPADAQIRLDAHGTVKSVSAGRPSEEAVSEATQYVRGLAKTRSGPRRRDIPTSTRRNWGCRGQARRTEVFSGCLD